MYHTPIHYYYGTMRDMRHHSARLASKRARTRAARKVFKLFTWTVVLIVTFPLLVSLIGWVVYVWRNY